MSAAPSILNAKDQWLQLGLAKAFFTQAELAAALTKAHTDGMEVSEVLRREGRLTEEQAAQLKADAAGVAFMNVLDYQIDAAVLNLVPERVARQYQVLPLYRLDQALTVAVTDPWDAVAIDALRKASQLPIIHPVVGTAAAIRKAIEHQYSAQVVDTASKHPVTTESVEAGTDARAADQRSNHRPATAAARAIVGEDVSIIKLVDALLGEALEVQASDIHLEPDSEHVRVRFRIDGVLHEIKLLPIGLQEGISSRIKILAKLDITEHRMPQDGRFSITLGGRPVDLRISTYPTIAGENVVIRLLDQSAVALQLPDLGFEADMREQFSRLIARPHGMLLVTGPTGSGKTTTLYAALSHINSMTKNIMTIEDPVEYHIPLIRQTQINLKAGVTFATGLRSILRQDPDVIMVGEIRDRETAEIAIHASLTGHLVLSTLHTNDSVGAIARLLDMGVEPYLVSSTLLAVIAQRLVRRVCPECQEGRRPSKDVKQRYPTLDVLYRGRGCRACRESGLSGRVGIFELLTITEALQASIAAKSAAGTLYALAREQGMRTMRQDGMLKVSRGETSLEELNRVAPDDAVAP